MNSIPRMAPIAALPLVLALVPAAIAAPVISPASGAPDALPASEISFLGATPASLSQISVVGSRSGRHGGRLRAFVSAPGAAFKPSKPFLPGEQVTVHARWRSSGALTTLTTSFTVATPVSLPLVSSTPSAGGEDVQSFRSTPRLRPPVVTVRAGDGTGAPGDLLATPAGDASQSGPMIFTSSGELVWFDPLRAGEQAANLRTQELAGREDLTWWQGRISSEGYGRGEDVIENADYHPVATVRAGNGLAADWHGFQLTPQGSAWVLSASPVQADLSSVGGPADGIVLDGVVQEIDVRTGLVMWEWQSLGHVPLSDSYTLPQPDAPYDYMHIDSLELDEQGNLVVTAANTRAVYYVNAHSGAIVWRLGGKHSSFTIGAGVAFADPQDATLLHGGQVSLLDDGGTLSARAEVVKLDRQAGSATLDATLPRTASSSPSADGGDVQSLGAGGWLVGWGAPSDFSEFDSGGHQIYEAQLPSADFSYRVYREPWSAQPTELPQLDEFNEAGTSTVYASWNGATTASAWQLLTGSSRARMAPVSTTPWGGFQTTIPAPGAAFYQVQALSSSGRVLASSRVIAAGGPAR